MTFWILLLVCINGAGGCTYSTGPTLKLDYQGSYMTADDCQKDAQVISDRYRDPELYGRCVEVRTPKPEGGK